MIGRPETSRSSVFWRPCGARASLVAEQETCSQHFNGITGHDRSFLALGRFSALGPSWIQQPRLGRSLAQPCSVCLARRSLGAGQKWRRCFMLASIAFCGLERCSLSLSCAQVRGTRAAPVLCLPDTKTSKRHGETEYIAVEDEVAIVLLHWLVARRNGQGTFFTASPAAFRTMFRRLAEAVGLDSAAFTPYSIRRGGATHDYMSHGNLDRSLVRGRWQTGRTARLYIKVGEELLARPWCVGRAAQLEALRQVFLNFVQKVHHFSRG